MYGGLPIATDEHKTADHELHAITLIMQATTGWRQRQVLEARSWLHLRFGGHPMLVSLFHEVALRSYQRQPGDTCV